MNQPVILVGMHRSGTSLAVRLLDQCGMFVGKRLEGNHEATFFVELNRFIMRNTGAIWTRPLPVMDLLEHGEARKSMADHLRHVLASPRAVSYLGAKGLLPGAIARMQGTWGWKDPRTTATLPLWLDLFPEAKIIRIDRHGVDVAASLRHRYQGAWKGGQVWQQRKRPLHAVVPAKKPFSKGHRIASLDGGMAMWDEYNQLADQHTEGLGKRLLHIKYEDLLQDPLPILEQMNQFAGLRDPTPEDVARVRADRAFAYRKDPELAACAKKHAKLLARHGY